MTITINNQPHQWHKPRISHLQVVIFAGLDPFGKMASIDISYTVKRGLVVEHGQIKPGGSVRTGEGMEIVVKVKPNTYNA